MNDLASRFHLLERNPIPWHEFSYAEIGEIALYADRHGLVALLNKARRATHRRDLRGMEA